MDKQMKEQSGRCRKRRTELGGTGMARAGRDKERPLNHKCYLGGGGGASPPALHRLTPKPSKVQVTGNRRQERKSEENSGERS